MDQKRIIELEQKISTDYGNTTGVAVLKDVYKRQSMDRAMEKAVPGS